MERSGTTVVLAHCLCNANAIVAGLARYPGAIRQLLVPIVEEGVGIIQLPCPETTYLGARRWGMTVEQYDTPGYRRHCRRLLEPCLDQIEDALAAGQNLLGVLGVEGSPSCGVETTCRGCEGGELGDEARYRRNRERIAAAPGSGVFMAVLRRMLDERGLSLPLADVSNGDPSRAAWPLARERLARRG
ncbi:MAG: hypothetical protein K9L28_11225 [Synergistales bacterium]|nr:hypothetical protein [Synergistales bacterium]